jgi:hypothetical protein
MHDKVYCPSPLMHLTSTWMEFEPPCVLHMGVRSEINNGNDLHMVFTNERGEHHLRQGQLVRKYTFTDGSPGSHGACMRLRPMIITLTLAEIKMHALFFACRRETLISYKDAMVSWNPACLVKVCCKEFLMINLNPSSLCLLAAGHGS